jgi:excisionase family DNA binding protein
MLITNVWKYNINRRKPVDNLLSVTDAAQRLGISRHTLNGWVSKHKVTFVKLGRRTLFNPADLERIIKAGTVEPRRRESE